MRVALISDIHGNAVALQAVLADLEAEGPDQIICLGDVAAMGPQPLQALELVRGLDCPVVMGNTDAWLLDPPQTPPADERGQRVFAINQWCAEQIGSERAFLATFQPTLTLDLGDGVALLCYHGTPVSNSAIIEATTPAASLREALGACSETLLAGGHTHAQLLRRTGGQWLINPGSVGLTFHQTVTGPRRGDPPWAEYALVDCRNGRIEVRLRAVPFDLQELEAVTAASGMPEAVWWMAGWTGRGGW